jgi:hypothetical protein
MNGKNPSWNEDPAKWSIMQPEVGMAVVVVKQDRSKEGGKFSTRAEARATGIIDNPNWKGLNLIKVHLDGGDEILVFRPHGRWWLSV